MYKGNQVIFEGIFSKYIKESAEGSMQPGIPWSFMGGNELTMTIQWFLQMDCSYKWKRQWIMTMDCSYIWYQTRDILRLFWGSLANAIFLRSFSFRFKALAAWRRTASDLFSTQDTSPDMSRAMRAFVSAFHGRRWPTPATGVIAHPGLSSPINLTSTLPSSVTAVGISTCFYERGV